MGAGEASRHRMPAPLAPPQADLQHHLHPGDVLLGKYEIVRKLGEGGFGLVLLAKTSSSGAQVAIKIIRQTSPSSESFGALRKEASIWLEMGEHPNTVKLYGFESVGGQMVLCMEYVKPDVDGRITFADHLRNGVGLKQLLYWARDISKGMSHAFARGLKAHRDLKPANIMISDFLKEIIGGIAKVSDFGLAGQMTSAMSFRSPEMHGTVSGQIAGTPTYMAPEQFHGLEHCTERSDIYSFGMMLYEGVNQGKLPLRLAQQYRDAQEMWTDLARQHYGTCFPEVKTPLWPIISRCLNKNPADRFNSFAEIIPLLEELLVDVFEAVPLQLACGTVQGNVLVVDIQQVQQTLGRLGR